MYRVPLPGPRGQIIFRGVASRRLFFVARAGWINGDFSGEYRYVVSTPIPSSSHRAPGSASRMSRCK